LGRNQPLAATQWSRTLSCGQYNSSYSKFLISFTLCLARTMQQHAAKAVANGQSWHNKEKEMYKELL
jgi:hypothetical protein